MIKQKGFVSIILAFSILLSCTYIASAEDLDVPEDETPVDDPIGDMQPDTDEAEIDTDGYISNEDEPENPNEPPSDPISDASTEPIAADEPSSPSDIEDANGLDQNGEASAEEQLLWPAAPTAYDYATGYSEDRTRMVQVAISQLPAEDDAPCETTFGNRNKYERWFMAECPGVALKYGPGGWSSLFLCWCAAQVGLTGPSKFPITLSAEELEGYLVVSGHSRHAIKEYLNADRPTLAFLPGSFVFEPIVGDDAVQLGKRVGLITAVDGERIEVIYGSYGNAVALKTYTLEDISSGRALVRASVVDYRYKTVAEEIFDFCRKELGFNEAAACGVLANVFAESCFSPYGTGDNGRSVGLFQWQGSRRTALNAFCESNDLDPSLVKSQLYFFKYELLLIFPKTCEACRNVENDANGAAIAASIFCINYEAPLNQFWNGKQRGMTAEQIMWPLFCYRAK